MITQTEETKYCPRCGIVPQSECVLSSEGMLHKCHLSKEDEENNIIARFRSCYESKEQFEMFREIAVERRQKHK